MKDVIDEIIEDNKDVIDLHEQKDKLITKTCEKCGKLLHGEQTYKETHAEMGDDEYITMMSIADDYKGGIGSLSHVCGYCLKHQSSIWCATGEHEGCKNCTCNCHKR